MALEALIGPLLEKSGFSKIPDYAIITQARKALERELGMTGPITLPNPSPLVMKPQRIIPFTQPLPAAEPVPMHVLQQMANAAPVEGKDYWQMPSGELVQPKKRLRKAQPLIPLDLQSVEGFVQSWADWLRYRSELGKPITPSTAALQLDKLSRMKDPVAAIRQSIERQYQGIFEARPEKEAKPAFEHAGDRRNRLYRESMEVAAQIARGEYPEAGNK